MGARKHMVVAAVFVGSMIAGGMGALPASAGPRTWSLSTMPTLATDNLLSAVSCSSESRCVAVGETFDGASFHAFIETWDGTAWSVAVSPSIADSSSLTGVSCRSDARCMAVGSADGDSGYRTLIEAWDGTVWAVVPSPNEGTDSVLQDVSCAEISTCTAAGYFNADGTSHPLIEQWNGASWSIVANPEPASSTGTLLAGISCPRPTRCFAVGSYRYVVDPGGSEEVATQTFVEKWNGTSWSVKHAADPGSHNNTFNAISCSGGKQCVAVGYSAAAIGPLIEMWDGTSWSVADRPNLGQYNELTSVSCPTHTRCVAVGEYNAGRRHGVARRSLVESWDGRKWSVTRSASHSGQDDWPQGVSCAVPASCRAVGVTYHGLGFDSLALVGRA